MLKFGISEEGFLRILASLKEAIEYTDNWEESWEEEYGEDWGAEDYAQPEEPNIGGWEISQEDFAKGELILAGMGMDVESMTPEQIADILAYNPNYLELVPQFNVQGQWVHTLRLLHPSLIQDEIEKIMISDKELCVTAGGAKEFWNFSQGRNFAIVMEGVCKVLWNADMYSVINSEEDQLVKHPGSRLEYIDEMTEGWIVPSECTLVGLKVNWDSVIDAYGFDNTVNLKSRIEEIANYFGIPIVEAANVEKSLTSLTILEAEDAADYATCEIDLENPEHLFEPLPAYETHLEFYEDEMIDAVKSVDLEKINELLAKGIQPPKWAWTVENFIKGLLDKSMPEDILWQLVNPILNTNDNTLRLLFTEAIWSMRFDVLDKLLDAGYIYMPDLPEDFPGIVEFLRASNAPIELIEKMLEPFTSGLLPTTILFASDPNDTELLNTLIYDLGAQLDFRNMNEAYRKKRYDLLKSISQIVGMDMIERYLNEALHEYPNDSHRIQELREFFETGKSPWE